MSLAFLFPGQGAQKVGMGRAFAESFPESRAVYEEADEVLGFNLSRLCFEGPDSELELTENTQPAVLVTSVAALRAAESRGLKASAVAGHSLGEYSALVAAGVLSLKDAVLAVRRRGRYMQEAVPVGLGAMAAVLRLPLDEIQAACAEAAQGQVVAPANINSPHQVVIAGHAPAVERASAACRAAGAKRAIPLRVSAPFHCSLMQPAQDLLAKDLETVAFRDPVVPVVNNVDAAVVREGAACRDALVRQVSAPVRWLEVATRLKSLGVSGVVELGPGSTLVNLMRETDPEMGRAAVSDPEGLDAALQLAGGAS